MPTLQQFRCLSALSETLNFHRAAERVNLSQPALSAQIAQIEARLGAQLVERSNRRVLFTPLGREVAERAKAILRDVEDIKELAKKARAPLTGILRLGVLPTLGPYLLPHILASLRAEYPELRLYLREEPAVRLLQELRTGELDAGLVSALEDPEGLHRENLFDEPLWLALPLDHPLAARAEIAPSDIAGERLILLDEGQSLRQEAQSFCRETGAFEHPDFRATSLDSLRQMVATGLGATLLPALYVAAEALDDPQIAVRPFRKGGAIRSPARRITLAWRQTAARAEDGRLFAALVRAHLPAEVTPIDRPSKTET